MNREQLLHGQSLIREIDFLAGLLSGGLEKSGSVIIKKTPISQPEVYPNCHSLVIEMMKDPNAIQVIISDGWKKQIEKAKRELEEKFDQL